jgi:hypothetical protein
MSNRPKPIEPLQPIDANGAGRYEQILKTMPEILRQIRESSPYGRDSAWEEVGPSSVEFELRGGSSSPRREMSRFGRPRSHAGGPDAIVARSISP